MGPEASADLYLRIIKICQRKYKARVDEDYPQILINSITPSDVVGKGAPWPVQKVIKEMREKVLPCLSKGVKILERAGADFIVIACNTVQYCLPEIRRFSKIKIISLPEEVRKILEKKEIKKVGILGTTNLIKMKIYEKEFKLAGIKSLYPSEKEQKKINQIILRLLGGEKDLADKFFLIRVINGLRKRGVKAVILACTELPLILNQKDCKVRLLDTTQILAEVATKMALK